MKKLKIFGLLLALAILSSFIPSNTNSSLYKTLQESWATLSKENYSIQYPEEWKPDQSGQMNTKFMLFSPTKDSNDSFSENVNLIVEDLTGHNISLDQYVELSENQVKSMLENGSIVSSERVNGDKEAYHKIIFTGNQGAFNLKFIQYYFVHPNKAYVLTLTCEANQFENYQATGEKILNSFQIFQK